MRLVLGQIPENKDFSPETEGWTRCRELNPRLVAWLVGPVVAFLLALALLVAVGAFTKIRPDGFSLVAFLALYLPIIAAHETIHAVVHPDRGLSDKTVLGFWPARGIFFTHFDGSRTRTNFLIGIITPFVLLTVTPFILAVIFGWTSWMLGVVIIWNGLSSSIDIIGFFNILAMVPINAEVRNVGWRTYFLLPNHEPTTT